MIRPDLAGFAGVALAALVLTAAVAAFAVVIGELVTRARVRRARRVVDESRAAHEAYRSGHVVVLREDRRRAGR